MKLSLVILLTIVAAGCGGYGSNSMPTTGSASNISTLVPNNTGTGAPSFTMTINGSGFTTNSVVFFNAVAEPTTFMSPTQLAAMIPASAIAASGAMPVYVRVTTGGGMYGPTSQNSNTVNFTVN
jgi:hypothetical protein